MAAGLYRREVRKVPERFFRVVFERKAPLPPVWENLLQGMLQPVCRPAGGLARAHGRRTVVVFQQHVVSPVRETGVFRQGVHGLPRQLHVSPEEPKGADLRAGAPLVHDFGVFGLAMVVVLRGRVDGQVLARRLGRAEIPAKGLAVRATNARVHKIRAGLAVVEPPCTGRA